MTMKPINPLSVVARIRNDYLRYLKTAFPLQDERIQQGFWDAIDQPDKLVKGPLLEATPEYEKGKSIQDLVEMGILNPRFEELCSKALPFNRSLYAHQEHAITKAVQHNRNIVVSTGTGSGKTEAFLIPILNHLLQEIDTGTINQPGVRALLLYPMNALANDQMKRLRGILHEYPQIKFGRYIGETEQKRQYAIDQFRQQFPDENIIENELISRDDMLDSPPHILLTNYAMLEFLLLRPRDSKFFDGKFANHWKFIVMDEAHIYDGALGIEISMLMRRLKDRIIQSETGKLQIFATSATLGKGKEDYPKVVNYASTLFAESFEWIEADPLKQDVVEAVRVPINSYKIDWGNADGSFYINLDKLLQTENNDMESMILAIENMTNAVPQNVKLIAKNEAIISERESWLNRYLFELFQGNKQIKQLQDILSENPVLVFDAAKIIFPDQQNNLDSIISLINIAVKAKPDVASSPLIPARYHVFARALEGAFVCLNFDHPSHAIEKNPSVSLKRHQECPHCHGPVFEISNCRQCGAIYLVGMEQDDQIIPIETDIDFWTREKNYYALASSFKAEEDDEDEVLFSEETNNKQSGEVRTICVVCGHFKSTCSCDDPKYIDLIEYSQVRGSMDKCVSCGKRKMGGNSPVSQVLTGQDAPLSVITIALYQELPDGQENREGVGNSRKLLIFSDSRQNAAFLAPYIEQVYEQFMQRRMIYQVLLEDCDGRNGELQVADVVDLVYRKASELKLFASRDSRRERRSQVYTWVMKELVSSDRYNNLESTGLVNFELIFPEGWIPAKELISKYGFTPVEVKELYRHLFNTLRKSSIVAFPDEVDPTDEAFRPTNFISSMNISGSNSKNHILSWLPSNNRSNKRVEYLIKVLRQIGFEADEEEYKKHAVAILEKIWKEISSKAIWTDEHVQSKSSKSIGTTYQVDCWCWNVVPTMTANRDVYRCNKCHQIFHVNVRNVCSTYCCDGTLEKISKDDQVYYQHHFRNMYETLDVVPLKAEEHTAQWEHKVAATTQQRFIKGEVNVLSCSTTFELGVDVGELQAVLMRNMPPTTANYIQRAGRAGRRIDSAALAVTFCQRKSHDFYYFAHPERMVSGKITPPVINIANEKIVRRHVHSVVLANYLRFLYDNFDLEFKTVDDFFFKTNENIDDKTAKSAFGEYLSLHPDELKDSLERVIPNEVQDSFELSQWGWVDRLLALNESSSSIEIPVLERAYLNIMGDVENVKQHQQELLEEMIKKPDNQNLAHQIRVVAGSLATINKRQLLSSLSTHGVLPKYGFPVDVVELKTQHLSFQGASDIALQRDLKIAISEYAPGAEVVAAKKIWTSGGVVKPFSKDWLVYEYFHCEKCGQFIYKIQAEGGNGIGITCPYCGESFTGGIRKFIQPEFGFVASRKPPEKAKFSRPTRIYATQSFFTDYHMPDDNEVLKETYINEPSLSSDTLKIEKKYSRFGWLLSINEGVNKQQFAVCPTCGYADKITFSDRGKKRKNHQNPITGRDCAGFTENFSLAHRFMTDVLEIRFIQKGVISDYHSEASLYRSVVYALLEGAVRTLSIRRNDLDGTILFNNGYFSAVIYDTVPGGAGHVERIGDNLPEVFQEACLHVSNDCCGLETSCSECLRNYFNQYYHSILKRGLAKNFLEKVLKQSN